MPGWHTTIFPPYFVAGAIFGGFAMVLTLMIPLREFCYPQLKDIITPRHIDVMCQDHPADGHHRRLRVHHGVLHRVVRRQHVRGTLGVPAFARCRARDGFDPELGAPATKRFPEAAVGAVLVGVLLHDELQRASRRSSSGSAGAGATSGSCF